MFTYLNQQRVMSDKGFIVRNTGRFTAEYQEGSNKISIELESGILPDGNFCDIIHLHAFHQWDGGDNIPKEKQAEIMRNYIEAMQFQGIRVIIH